MKKEKREAKLLRLWKARQVKEGHDVSGVNTLEDAERYFDKPKAAKKPAAKKPAAKKPAAKKGEQE